MTQENYIELLNQAQRGNEKALDCLAELAAKRLRVYVYRLTLEDDLTQEIVQETMLEMCRILGKLKKADRFWPWLYGIATNKIHRHRRTERTQKNFARSRANQAPPKQREQGLQNLVSQELKQIVATAMQNLKIRYRAVLVMRCYDQMSYAQIAESMGSSEFSTRMLFLRAKRALAKQLSRNGFGRGSLLTALVLFGKMTAPTEAAAVQVSVTAATTSVGLLTGLVGLATTKTAIISLSTAGIIAGGAIAVKTDMIGMYSKTGAQSAADTPVVSPLGYAQNGQEEYWYYFPEGVDKPMMMRVRTGAGGTTPHAQFLQNDQANFCFNNNIIHINNHRMYAADLSVLRLPTDTPQFSDFLTRVEGGRGKQKMQYVPDRTQGLFVITAPSGPEGANLSWVTRHYSVLDEDYFQGDWPAGLNTIDKRDAMHKRGWTYFSITGKVNGKTVSGTGRIPFAYAASGRHSPWMKLKLGDDLTVVDTTQRAYISGTSLAALKSYKPGTFFKGLPRPWMGLHTIDTVRRDAAEHRIPFKIEQIDEKKVRVVLTHEQVTLVYTIDLEIDVVDEIAFSTSGTGRGTLRFSYMQSIADVGKEFVSPRSTSYRGGQHHNLGLLWLMQLADGSLEK